VPEARRERRQPGVVEEDDRVAGVEAEEVDLRVVDQPSTFSTGT